MVNTMLFSIVNHGHFHPTSGKEPAIPRMLRLSREFLDLAERHPSPLKRPRSQRKWHLGSYNMYNSLV